MSETTLSRHVDCKKILLKRLVNAVLCNVCAQMLFLLALLLPINFNLNPSAWLHNVLQVITSFATWANVVPLSVITLTQGIICSRDYITANTYRTSRFTKLLGVLTLRSVAMLLLHAFASGFMVWLVVGKSIYVQCGSKRLCLQEDSFYLICNALWIGVYYFVKDFLSYRTALTFFVIQQSKFLMVKSKATEIFYEALSEAVNPTVYFACAYVARGSCLRDYVALQSGLNVQRESNFSGWSVELVACCWLCSSFFVFTILCMKLFFKVVLTEHLEFAVDSERPDELVLRETLLMKHVPVVQYLGCLDLYFLSKWDARRRKQIFALSLPGGHPYNWDRLLQQILKLITGFTCDINKSMEASFSGDHVKEEIPAAIASDVRPQENLLRNMSLFRSDSLRTVEISYNELALNLLRTAKSWMKRCMDKLWDAVRKKYVVDWAFGEVAESRILHVLSDGQPVILCVQGLSHMVTASFCEDTYGVVQKDIPVIVSSLLGLKASLDKLNKVTVSRRGSAGDLQRAQLRTALRTATKRCLYNICGTFGDYMLQVTLAKDVAVQIHSYLAYKEG